MPLQWPAPFAQVDPHRTCNTARADADVAVKPLVFRCNDRVAQIVRHRLRLHDAAKLVATPGEHVARSVQQSHRPPRAPIIKRRRIGQGRPKIKHDQTQNHRRDRTDPPRQPPKQAQKPHPKARKNVALTRRLLAFLAFGGRHSLFLGRSSLLRIATLRHQRFLTFA